jgi:hypothetical protein
MCTLWSSRPVRPCPEEVAAGPNGLHAGVGPGPAGQVVVIKRGMFPMIGRAEMAWKR